MDSVCHDGHGGFIDLLFPVRIGSWKRFFLLHTKLAKFWNAFFQKKKKRGMLQSTKTATPGNLWLWTSWKPEGGGTKILRLPTSFYTWNCSLLSFRTGFWSHSLEPEASEAWKLSHWHCFNGWEATRLIWLDDERMIFVYLCILYIYTCNYDILWYIYIYVDYIYSIYIYIQYIE